MELKKILGLGISILFLLGCATNSAKSDSGAKGKVSKAYKNMSSAKKYSTYTFNPEITFQTIDGFGAAYTWYSEWLFHEGKSGNDAFDAIFSDAKMSVLRFKNEYEYKTKGKAENGASMAKYYNGALKRCAEYGEKPIILMCCWSPPAALKSNDHIDGDKGATLKKNANGKYCYEEYGEWWADSIEYYKSLGINVDYVSIQNEVEFVASYDGCRFDPYENNQTAGYGKAYAAVYRAFKKRFGDEAPKMLGPETMSCVWSTIYPYVKAVREEEPESLDGIAHHLYVGGSADEKAGSVDAGSFITPLMGLGDHFKNEKKWQTEYFIGHAIQQAELINYVLTYENANAYIFWSGIWSVTNSTFENGYMTGINWNGNWDKRAKYYVMRHFSEYVRPGYTRVKAVSGNGDVKTSAYVSPDGNKTVLVLVNTSDKPQGFTFSGTGYTINSMHAYESVFGEKAMDEKACWIDRGELPSDAKVSLYPKSVMTIVMEGGK